MEENLNGCGVCGSLYDADLFEDKDKPQYIAPKVSFSVATSHNSLLTKKITADGGKLKKTAAAQMVEGECRAVAMPLSGLPDLIKSLKPNQAIVHGVSNVKNALITSESAFKGKKVPFSGGKNALVPSESAFKEKNPTITRTKKFFSYPKPAAMTMIDYDPPPGGKTLPTDELIKAIGKIAPGFKDCAKVVSSSTSSCILDKDGNEITGKGSGYHIYFAVVDGKDIERFKDVFFKRCWLRGHGYIKISKSGAMLERCDLFDPYVMSPERLDFVAGAELGDGLVQNRPDPVYIDGGRLDTSAVRDLSVAEEQAYIKAVEKAKSKMLGAAADARAGFIDVKAEKLSKKRNISKEKARLVIETACCNADLHSDFMLFFDDIGATSVADVLANTTAYDAQPLADPLEPDERCKAIFYANDGGKPIIHSFKHGEHVYFLHVGAPPLRKISNFKAAADHISCVSSAEQIEQEWLDLATFLNAADLKRFINLVSTRTGTLKGDLREDLKEYKKESAEKLKKEKKKEKIEKTAEVNEILPFKPFWHESEDASGSPVLKILYNPLYDLLEAKGIKKLLVDAHSTKIKTHIKIVENIMEEIDVSDIRRLVFQWIDDLPDQISPNFTLGDLREVLRKGIHSYIEDAKLDTIEHIRVDPLRDTPDKSFLFFKNGFVEVTAEGNKLRPYADMPGTIWKSQIINFDIDIIGFSGDAAAKSDFFNFTKNICSDRSDDGSTTLDAKRYESLASVIGYLLHNYNDPAYSKAIILSDASLEDKPEGGSGKGLLCQAISQIRKRCLVDGKNFTHDAQFALSQIDLDTQIVVFDDVRQHFNFERMFSFITEGYSAEKKYGHRYSFPFEKNPKTIITTNYSIKGDGASFRRRKFEFELYNYYNDLHTPEVEFGRMFFSTQWDRTQWNPFFNICILFIQKFLASGRKIIEYESATLGTKKIQNQIGKNAFEFFENLNLEEWIENSAAYQSFCNEYLNAKGRNVYSQRRFTVYLKAYCAFKGYGYESKVFFEDGQSVRKFIIFGS